MACQMGTLKTRKVLLRILNIVRHRSDDGLQSWVPADEEISTVTAVGIDVGDGVLVQFADVGFDPFDGAQQAGLFAIPCAINDGAFGRPALLVQFAESARFFEFGRHAGDGIVGAVDPRVMMIAANDPLIGIGAGDRGDDVVERLDVPVGERPSSARARDRGRRDR